MEADPRFREAPPRDPRPLYNLKQIAELLNCTTGHVGALVEVGKLAAVNLTVDLSKRAVLRVWPASLDHFRLPPASSPSAHLREKIKADVRPYLTVEQAMERLGIDRLHIEELFAEGILFAVDLSTPGTVSGRQTLRIPPASVEERLAALA